MMTGKVVNEYATFPDSGGSNATYVAEALTTSDPLPEVYSPIQVATIVCFMAGVWSVSNEGLNF